MSDPLATPANPPPRWLDRVAAISAATTSATLVLSVAHETGFFLLVGNSWITLQTIGDYLASAIEWLPSALVLSCLSYLVYQARSRSATIKAIANHRNLFLAAAAVYIGFCVVLVFLAPLSTMFSLILGAVVGGIVLVAEERAQKHSTAAMHISWLFAFVLISIISSFGFGLVKAHQYLDGTREGATVTVKDNPPMTALVLKFMERGVLLRVGENNQFYKWESVVSVSQYAAPTDGRALGCLWLGWFCAKESAGGSAAP